MIIVWAWLIISVIGAAVSAYLTRESRADLLALPGGIDGSRYIVWSRLARELIRLSIHVLYILAGLAALGILPWLLPYIVWFLMYGNFGLVLNSLIDARSRALVLELQEPALRQYLDEAVISIDDSSTIVSANHAAHQLFGWQPGTLIGHSLIEIQPERYRSAHLAALSHYVKTGVRSLDWDGIHGHGLRADGSEFPLVIVLNEHRLEGHQLFTGIVREE